MPSRDNDVSNVLIVDDDPKLASFMLKMLARKGIRGTVAETADEAAHHLERSDYNIIFINDMIRANSGSERRLSHTSELLYKIRMDSPEVPVIMMTDPGQTEDTNRHQIAQKAVCAMQSGCRDFMVKPLVPGKAERILDTLAPSHHVDVCDSAQQGINTLYRIVGRSKKLNQTVSLAKRIAPTSVPVLISGPSGTGKELISFLIHQNSRRSEGPYVRVNCAALSDTLLESELFGHEKGAFTGAYSQRRGRFEMAHGGTLLLDEITETPLKFQAKLLRVLEQQDFERVGGNDTVQVDVRIISTTNKDLLREVENGSFRRDLYYRLSGLRLMVSPLSERAEDLPDLVWHFVNTHARQVGRRITELDPGMMKIFASYDWPGNVRQLRNVVLTSLILGVGPTLSLADVSWLFDELQPRQQSGGPGAGEPVEADLGGIPLVQLEKQAILDTLKQTDGNRTQAARVLGISDRTLRDKMKRYRQEETLQPVG